MRDREPAVARFLTSWRARGQHRTRQTREQRGCDVFARAVEGPDLAGVIQRIDELQHGEVQLVALVEKNRAGFRARQTSRLGQQKSESLKRIRLGSESPADAIQLLLIGLHRLSFPRTACRRARTGRYWRNFRPER